MFEKILGECIFYFKKFYNNLEFRVNIKIFTYYKINNGNNKFVYVLSTDFNSQ